MRHLYEKVLDKMLTGKKVRLNKAGRNSWTTNGTSLQGDVWNTIIAIHNNDSVTLVSDNHLVLHEVAFNHIYGLES